MKAKYDAEVDVLTITWDNTPIEESESISPGVILDYDQDGNVIGIEILNASRKIENFSPNLQVACKLEWGTKPNINFHNILMLCFGLHYLQFYLSVLRVILSGALRRIVINIPEREKKYQKLAEDINQIIRH